MAKDIALDLDEEAEGAGDQPVGAGSKNREATTVDEPDYINKDDGENLAEITGAGDGETAACPLPVAAPRGEPPQVSRPGQGSSYGEHHILRQTHLVIKNEGQVTLAELQSKVPPPATAAKVTPSMMVSNSMRPNTGPQPSQPAAERQTSDAPESQERKRSISMCSQREGDVGLTAWQSPIPAGCSRRRAKRSENAVEADIGHAQAVTCWNSRLNDWVIDLTAEDMD
ncbi:uncharacterized protein PITG_15593 [Phytophthora infestans T30-4]|uniref:Uncharacterized protein n=1 Tax=Phytophthora infestans (strain T30-4) TaxID=403677 RepID=D0NT48_PHYIT|nr:uncharacterized protein PITG_15593 [Phytophthora infestans T30-4]EEY64804.1 conserved hypothetical protein [Phytophthora infestans T30-4]|eukprot:XP_002897731.1 conserved hypothetical protein [Phytophthora infestans T30-4]